MRFAIQLASVAASMTLSVAVHAQTYRVPMQLVGSTGNLESVGTVTITESAKGVVFTPALRKLPPGLHGFHIHEKPSCDPAMDPEKNQPAAARAAGGHLDPKSSGRHEGPAGNGHLGDLPALTVNNDGTADTPVVAQRIKLSDLPGHALMIHAGGDNYSDSPEKLGGGGDRIACGVIEKR
jgi:superoxide dismutase, Cu-Zn family